MTISTEAIVAGPFTGNGATSVFSFAFKVFVDTDVLVKHTTVGGVDSTLVLNTGYSVSRNANQDNNPGGTITYKVAGVTTNLPQDEKLTVTSQVPNTQGTALPSGGSYAAKTVERMIDKVTILVKQFGRSVTRSLVIPITDGITLNELPNVANRKSKVLAFDTAGQPIAQANVPTSGVAATAFWETVLDDADASTSLTTLGFSAYVKTLISAASAAALRVLFTPLTTKGDLWGFAAIDARVAVGSEAAVLHADPAQASGLSYTRLGAGSVRQSVLVAALNSDGYNAAITTGSGLRPGLDASPTPMVLAFAAGFGALGAQDLVASLSADAADPLGADMKASNINFMHATWASLSSVTWGQTLVPPQYGYAFDRTKGALLNFEGADASTTMLDDFGNTWTANGNAQIDTAQFKFGASSLLLDGTGDYIKSTNFTTLGDGSWEMSLWFRINANPANDTEFALMTARNAADFGFYLSLSDTAGTEKLKMFLSESGTSWDVMNGTLGANTTWTAGQWNRVRVVFDALGGTYKAYLSLNGAAETVDISLTNSSRVCAITNMTAGATSTGTNSFNGWIDAFRFTPCATATAAETPSASAPTITDYPVHFFSTPEMKMYEVTAASASAGVNPGMTQENRVFVAEADTGAASVTAVRNYAIRGEHRSAELTVTSSLVNTVEHNLGVIPRLVDSVLVCKTTNAEWKPGDEILVNPNYYDGTSARLWSAGSTRNTLTHVSGTAGPAVVPKVSAGAAIAVTGTNWKWRINSKRGW